MIPALSRRTMLTLSTAAALYGAYVVYALVVSPWFAPLSEVPGLPFHKGAPLPTVDHRPQEPRRAAERYLAEQVWAADAKYQVRTSQAYIYTEEWNPTVGGDEVRCKPFALILKSENDPENTQPTTIVCDSALLRFAGKMENMTTNPGRLIGGAFEGQVEIRGAEGLAISGRNLNFSEQSQRAWSDHPITFAYGPHSGAGHGLELDLVPGPVTADKPAVSGVRAVRLRRDVVLELVSTPKDARKPADIVRLRSSGPFQFQLETNIATFRDEVFVNHPTSETQFDTLSCDALTMIFAPAEAPATAGTTAAPAAAAPADAPAGAPAAADGGVAVAALPAAGDTRKSRAGNLEFRRLKAEGKLVRLTSDRSQLKADMTVLTYDAVSHVAVLQDPHDVKVVQRNHDIYCPEITLVHDQRGQINSAVCRGAGKLRSYKVDATRPLQRGPLLMSGDWLKQLKKYPDDEQGWDVIEFEGQVVLNQPDQLALEAEIVKIWTTPLGKQPAKSVDPARGDGNELTPTGSGPDSSPREASPEKRDKSFGSPKPKRLLALKDVTFASDQIAGQTQQLDLRFEEGTLPFLHPPGPVTQQKPASLPIAQRPATGRPPLRVGTQKPTALQADRTPAGTVKTARTGRGLANVNDDRPDASRVAALPAGTGPAEARPRPPRAGKPAELPLALSADVIRVRSIQDGDKSEVVEMWNEGHVVVTQERTTGEAPLRVEGDRLHITNYAENAQILRVMGKPAQVQDRGLNLEGASIFLDRGLNVAKVDGAGMLRLPMKNNPQDPASRPLATGPSTTGPSATGPSATGPSATAPSATGPSATGPSVSGQAAPKPQFLEVWWKEQMHFDGEQAKFFVDVIAHFEHNRLRCQQMQVSLSQRISFADSNSSGEKVEVLGVLCQENVSAETHEYLGTRLQSIRKATAWELAINQTTGDTQALGPGTLQMWRRGNGRRAGLSPNAAVQANRPLQADQVEWEYLRLDFAGKMVGNVRDRLTTVEDRVRVVYGPVEGTTSTVDPDNLPKDGGWMRCDQLQVRQHVETARQAAYLEMLGKGNAELEGRTFHALADNISYDESIGLFVLRAVGNRKATIWRQTRIGGPVDNRAQAQRIEFIPSKNQVKLDRTSGLEGVE